MTETPDNSTSVSKSQKTSRQERIVKIAFVAVVIVAGAVVYLLQTRGLSISGWGEDLSSALDRARREDRPVVAMFVSSPPSATARELRTHVLRPANQKAIEEGGYIPVVVNTDLNTQIARTYKLRTLPTLMVIRPDGTERNRSEGNVGEVPFRQEFLDYRP